MLSTFITAARANPRTTFAGLAGFASLLAGMVATGQTGSWWPVLAGVAAKGIADLAGHALAADAKGGAS